ncbi:flippase-like domain-containing protein [Kineosporia sp. J2-2]|uniref:Flippase-like domain-containing protein n=1 Tax=Kineosporia corallincola TaxID=2835133 RepID=A0ABS5TGZ7_9ACTN|nr:lysylphosphatidylglycerol synthase domain-containing protein [Kineosporia corallincola]MBT0770342.1 flippase-like domain-containing protein [Kineosporia corallincola]
MSGAVARVGALAGRASELSRARWFRVCFGLLLVGLAVWAVLSQRHQVADALSQLSPGWVVVAALATVVNVALAGMVWRTLLADLGSRLSLQVAARIFFVGQLGKYLPGSVWPVVMQTELGRDHQVPRRRTATATVVSMLLSVLSALLVVLIALPFAPEALPSGFGWAVLLIVPLAVVLHPAVMGRLVDRALKIVSKEGLPERTSGRGTLAATLWAVGSWVGAGLQVWALSVPLGADANVSTALLLIGGYALAWAVGFVVIIAPAGAGAREVALAAVLSTVLDSHGEVVVVVLISRVLFTAVDLLAAGAGILTARRHRISA